MKRLSIGPILYSFLLFNASCKKEICEKLTSYKGRLEVMGICGNFTVKVLEGAIDPAFIECSWTNDRTGITYQNVFRLSNPCDLPITIKEGDEFKFRIKSEDKGCAACLAYYPTPNKRLTIEVLNKH